MPPVSEPPAPSDPCNGRRALRHLRVCGAPLARTAYVRELCPGPARQGRPQYLLFSATPAGGGEAGCGLRAAPVCRLPLALSSPSAARRGVGLPGWEGERQQRPYSLSTRSMASMPNVDRDRRRGCGAPSPYHTPSYFHPRRQGYTVEPQDATLPPSQSDSRPVDAAKKGRAQGSGGRRDHNTSEFHVPTPRPTLGPSSSTRPFARARGRRPRRLGPLKDKCRTPMFVRHAGRLVATRASLSRNRLRRRPQGRVLRSPAASQVCLRHVRASTRGTEDGKDTSLPEELPDVIVVGGNAGGSSTPAGRGTWS